MIRFIDVGLILLFGFLVISDIDELAKVRLGPQEARSGETTVDDRTTLLVYIGPEGTFVVMEWQSGEVLVPEIAEAAALESYLAGATSSDTSTGIRPLVVIQPHPESTVQRLVDVMDVCDRLSLEKNLSSRPDFELTTTS